MTVAPQGSSPESLNTLGSHPDRGVAGRTGALYQAFFGERGDDAGQLGVGDDALLLVDAVGPDFLADSVGAGQAIHEVVVGDRAEDFDFKSGKVGHFNLLWLASIEAITLYPPIKQKRKAKKHFA